MKVGNEPENGHSHYLKGEPPMSNTKQAELSAVATEVLEVVRASEKPMTLAEIKAIVPTANSAHLTALKTRGLVQAEDVEIVVQSKRTVLAYSVKN